jgi:hypothetical protein
MTEPVTRAADHQRILHLGMAAQRLLHLLDEDLLPTGIHHHGIAAEHANAAVRFDHGAITGHGQTDARDNRKGGQRLLGIVEIAEGHAPSAGRPAELVIAWLEDPTAVG